MSDIQANFGEFEDGGWAIPVSYRQLVESGVELNSSFDDDAGAGDGHGEIVLVKRGTFAPMVLQCTFAKPEPHWANCEQTYYSASGSRDLTDRLRNESAMEALWDSLITPEQESQIANSPPTCLAEAAERIQGMSMGDPDAIRIMNDADWSDVWPVVDENGIFTGDIAGSGTEGMELVDWNPTDECIVRGEGCCEAALIP
jgi:hypothetical protein